MVTHLGQLLVQTISAQLLGLKARCEPLVRLIGQGRAHWDGESVRALASARTGTQGKGARRRLECVAAYRSRLLRLGM